jgi:hypothetical protein
MHNEIIYEVGTYEKYEEGFHAFFRCLSKERALFVLNIAKEIKSKIPEYTSTQTDDEFAQTVKLCEQLNKEFFERTGKRFDITMYEGDLYTIEMRAVQLDK